MADIESKGSRNVVKEEVENITNIDGTRTSITRKHYSDGSIVESTSTSPTIAVSAFAVPSPLPPVGAGKGADGTSAAAALAAAQKEKKNGTKTCLVISASLTGGLSFLCFILMFVAPITLFGGIGFAIVCAILGIIQCATGNCCCGKGDA